MKLPIQERYQTIYFLYKFHFREDIYETSKFCGCSINTVKNVIFRIEHPTPFIKKGPEPIIKPHHEIFIEIQTELDHYITNKQLSELLIQNFSDITHCSENTVSSARKRLNIIYSPPHSAVKMNDHSRKKRVEWCKYHLENKTSFENVIFSDESWFDFDLNRQWLWRKKKIIHQMYVEKSKHIHLG